VREDAGATRGKGAEGGDALGDADAWCERRLDHGELGEAAGLACGHGAELGVLLAEQHHLRAELVELLLLLHAVERGGLAVAAAALGQPLHPLRVLLVCGSE